MSPSKERRRPIIVKRHAAHDDEHGGQWKVAYADFVTAMMAFFLIMWLLSSVSSDNREVIAKYFSSTSMFDLPAGTGVLNGGRSVMDGADPKPTRGAPTAKDTSITPEQRKDAKPAEVASPPADRAEVQRIEALKAEMDKMMRDGELKNAASHIDVSITPEGLRIQIFDRDGEPMFAPGSAEPLPRLKAILGVIAQVLGTVRNNVVLAGYTDAQALQRNNYSNWELSADRANSVRRTLEGNGLAQGRVVLVEGRGARDLLLPQNPTDPRNRRIAVTILRNDVNRVGGSPITRPAQPATP
jgi:chemotaxis protein MotB